MREYKDMTVSQLKEIVDYYQKEIYCTGTGIGSHPTIESDVTFYCEELDLWFDIKSIEPSRMMGCGCWSGIDIELEVDKD